MSGSKKNKYDEICELRGRIKRVVPSRWWEDINREFECWMNLYIPGYAYNVVTPAATERDKAKGEWIWEENEWQYRCSACRMTFDYDKTCELFDHGYQHANFCPECGRNLKEIREGDKVYPSIYARLEEMEDEDGNI